MYFFLILASRWLLYGMTTSTQNDTSDIGPIISMIASLILLIFLSFINKKGSSRYG